MELTAMHYSLQYQHLVEGISEHQRGRCMNRNVVLAGLEGGHVEEIIATPIIQPKSECLHLRADSPNIVAKLPDICKFPAVDSGDGGDNNGDNILTASIESEDAPVFLVECMIDLQYKHREWSSS